jgi:hypothetical protein
LELFSDSHWINWDWILKVWINKSIIRRLDTKEIKDYDQEKLKKTLSLQKEMELKMLLDQENITFGDVIFTR